MTWHLGPLVAFDLETTGLNVETDRVVTAAVIGISPDENAGPDREQVRWQAVNRLGWIANPGIPIPPPAAAVHGITTEQALTVGRPAVQVIREIAAALTRHVQAGTPIVAMNARYDLTLFDRELYRYGLPSLAEQAGYEPLVIDPMVLDKVVDQFRSGKRTLTDLCRVYGVDLTGAHQAAADALAAARVAAAIGRLYPRVGEMTLADLHKNQTVWAGGQADSYRSWLLRQGRPADDVRSEWPLIPRQAAGQ